MENASKALLISGGVLIAIIVISIAMGIWNTGTGAFGTFEKKKVALQKEEEMAKFSQYVGDIYGSEVQNCIRRITTYNEMNGTEMIVVVYYFKGGKNDLTIEEHSSISETVQKNGYAPNVIDTIYKNDIFKGTMETNTKTGTITRMIFKRKV